MYGHTQHRGRKHFCHFCLTAFSTAEFMNRENPDEFHTSKFQKHAACSHGYKLVCFDDKFSQPFKP